MCFYFQFDIWELVIRVNQLKKVSILLINVKIQGSKYKER